MDAQKKRDRILIFLGLSLLAHVFAVTALYFVRSETPHVPQAVFVDLNSLPPSVLADMAREADKAKQIVETEQSNDLSTPDDAKFLGERNQKAENTKARQVDIFHKGGPSAPKAGQDGQNLALKDLAPRRPITPPTQQEMDGYRQKAERLAQRQAGGAPGAPGQEGSATNDFLRDVKEGDRTMLSTKEFVYFGYYRRIRQKLEVAWNSRLRSTLEGYVYGGRRLANDKDYVTGVVVVLDASGQITAVQVLQQSGAKDLDQAAVDAFNAAGPFPDPPSGLADENGEIKIPWSFILQS